ncbi:MAG: hypothetical protein ACM33T_12545 [Solirubrobacterales bacterium]
MTPARPPVHAGPHPAVHAATHGHPHSKAHLAKAKTGGKTGGKSWWWVGAAALVAAGAWAWQTFGPGDALTPEEKLVEQMTLAASGTVYPTHAFGGELSIQRGERGLNVIARNLPAKACVTVGWRLAKSGTIIVNGNMPVRLSAARLSEICAEPDADATGATLTWVPDTQ